MRATTRARLNHWSFFAATNVVLFAGIVGLQRLWGGWLGVAVACVFAAAWGVFTSGKQSELYKVMKKQEKFEARSL